MYMTTVQVYVIGSVKASLCPIREKLDLLETVELKDNRAPVERLVAQDLLDLLEHRFVCHRRYHPELLKWVFTA